MALRYAVATGNWSNTATWNGGTLPGVGDDVYSNGFTVTIDQNITATKISNEAASPAVVGGMFKAVNGVIITANVFSGAAAGQCFLYDLGSGNTVSIHGNLSTENSGANSAYAVNKTGVGTLNIVGDLLPHLNTSAATNPPLSVNAIGDIYITGNIYGRNASGKSGVIASAAANFYIIGSITGGSVANCFGITASAAANFVITGSVIGSAAPAIQSTQASNLVLTGVATAGATPAILFTSNTGTVTVDGVLNCLAGIMPVYAYRIFMGNAVTQWKFQKSTLIDRILYSADTLPGVPANHDVRNGVTYGPIGEITGDLIVPDPGNVRVGVPTDNTIGTAELTAADFIAALNDSTNPLAERLRNVATVQTTGDQIAALNTEE
jgi:hypothetical protein